MGRRSTPDAWDDLLRTAAEVRAGVAPRAAERPRAPRHPALRCMLIGAPILAACAIAAIHVAGATSSAQADAGADGTLFSLTNQDRASNGVRSLTYNGTLQNLAEGGSAHPCGSTISGRSVDMIRRNYFAHAIPPCNAYVWVIYAEYGVRYQSAGENIGWVQGYGGGSGSSGAGYVNGAFMASPDHRANILNRNYTQLGVGSAWGASWSGAGAMSNVWMFSEEFIQAPGGGGGGGPPPPRPTPRPTPRATPRPGTTPARNSPAPAAPRQPPAQAPTPVATPTPTPIPTIAPTPPVPSGLLPSNLPPPPIGQYEGLLPNSIESVLQAFLSL